MSEVLDLGISQAELREQIIERAAAKFCELAFEDTARNAVRQINERMEEVIRKTVDKTVDEKLLPVVNGHIDRIVLQATNAWGEKRGAPLSFTEYIVQRAETYLTERVNYKGEGRSEISYSWEGTQTRIAHMVHQHLHYAIETAMRNALQLANSALVQGIQETVKIKLQEVAAKLKVEVKT